MALDGTNVVTSVVANGVCTGCGVCAAVCAKNTLEMAFTERGEYEPRLTGQCLQGCSLCVRVCPFSGGALDETAIATKQFGSQPGLNSDPVAGLVHKTFVGYSDADRQTAASGGLTTWILRQLLERRLVTHVVTARPQQGSGPLFGPVVISDPEELVRAQGSFYYPIEYSGVLRSIRDDVDGTYAIVALPCVAKGIRLASYYDRKLRDRIRYIVALACGQRPNALYTEFLASWGGLLAGDIGSACYRCYQGGAQRSSEFGFVAFTRDGRRQSKLVSYPGLSYGLWTNQFFTPKACGYCDDIFAETADVVLMDAWLPRYDHDVRGTSLVLSRNTQISTIFEEGNAAGQCHARPISLEDLQTSQRGPIFKKRELLRARLAWAKRTYRWAPTKRVSADESLLRDHYWQIEAQERFRRLSSERWRVFRNRRPALVMSRLFLADCLLRAGVPAIIAMKQTYLLLPHVLRRVIAALAAARRYLRRNWGNLSER